MSSSGCVLRHLMRAAIKGSFVAIRARRSSSACVLRHLKLAALCHRHFDLVLARCLGERPRRRAPPVRRPRLINGSFENRRLERRTGRLPLGLADDAIPDEGGNQGLIRRNQSSSVAAVHTRTLRQRSSELIRGHQRSSELIRGHQSSSELVRGHQRSLRGRQSCGTYMYSSPCGASSTRTWVVTC